MVNNTVVDSHVIDILETGNATTLGLWWSPNFDGMFNVTVRVVPMPEESQLKDNGVSAYVCVGGSTTIRVPDHFFTLVEAVDAAISGDTIFVAAGTYYDANTIIKKDSLTLVGENKETTIIDGVLWGMPSPGRWATLTIQASNVTVQGFTILDGFCGLIVGLEPDSTGPCEWNENVIRGNIITTGVFIKSANNNSVCENILTGAQEHAGIDMISAHDNFIYNNTIVDNHDGLWLSGSHNNSIVANDIANNGGGVWLYGSGGNVLRNNSLTGNLFEVQGEEVEHYINDVDFSNTLDGKPICYLVNQRDMQVPTDVAFMALVNCTNLVVKDANLSKISILLFHTSDSIIQNITALGIDLRKSNGVLVNKSMITGGGAWGDSGVFIYKSSNNTIANNVITRNYGGGIKIYSSVEFNTIVNNTISNNGIGVALVVSSNNTAYHNNFINNTRQTSEIEPSKFNVWDNGYPSGGNYWSDYDGTDAYHGICQNETGSDGIGDTPYKEDNYPLMSPYWYWNNPIAGDIDRDRDVDSMDLFALAAAYGTKQDDPLYNPNCDFDSDGDVDSMDLFTLAPNYGKTA